MHQIKKINKNLRRILCLLQSTCPHDREDERNGNQTKSIAMIIEELFYIKHIGSLLSVILIGMSTHARI
ncbi:hypothetical protein D0466_20070 [Peribacillus glennii]|uniref:Uncharacterized protein n=1 Tax=Peribacillus glennii TaxID=2303991 RepID=A0A372L8V7_9BACI|nr:hypothetical protein D0466_20070 [Peribacillus glennii]